MQGYRQIARKEFNNIEKEVEVRGEDIPFWVQELTSKGKNAVGLTGEDLFKEFSIENPNTKLKILKKISWVDEKAMFGKPTLCLMGDKNKKLEAMPKNLRVAISSKYKEIAKRYLNLLEQKDGFNFSKVYVNGAVETTLMEGISDLVIDVVYSGSSMKKNNLQIYDKIMESDFVIIGFAKEKKTIEPRRAVIEMQDYSPPIEGRSGFIRLDFNENTVGCSPKVNEILKNIQRDKISMYPEYNELKRKLASFLNIKPPQLLLTNATDEAIKVVMETYVEKGKDEVIIPVPTFAMFKFYAQLSEAIIKEVLYNDNLSFPTERILNEISPKTKIVVLVNPNNPTGTAIKREDIVKIIDKAAENNALVLIDEAYYPFYDETCIDMINKYDNVAITRTFSKAFGMANLRIGYIVSSKINIKNIQKVNSPYSINGVAVACAITALDDYNYVNEYVSETNKNKKLLYNEFDKLNLKYYKSDANFILINFGNKCSQYSEKLREKGILVRDRSNDALLEGFLRITIGSKEQNEKLINALKEINDAIISEKKLLIFDIDGVLVDVSKSYRESIKKTVKYFSEKDIDENQIKEYKNSGGYNNDWDLTEAILKKYGVKTKKQEIINKFNEFYWQLINDEKWLLDKDILKKLSRKYALAIMTGRPKKDADYVIQKNNVADYFAEIITLEDVKEGKPNPEGLLKLLKKINTENAIYFGDTIDDIKAAINANIIAIGVLPPQDKSSELKNILLKTGAKQIINDINEIDQVL